MDEAADRRRATGSLLATVEQLHRPGQRTLQKLDERMTPAQEETVAQDDLIDPGEAVSPEYFVNRAIPREHVSGGRRQLLIFLGCIGLLLLLGAAWRWTPMADWIEPSRLAHSLEWFARPSGRLFGVLLILVVASLLMVPLSLLIMASAVLLGPWLGFSCSMVA